MSRVTAAPPSRRRCWPRARRGRDRRSGHPDVNKLTETVASLWKEIGVTATLNVADSGTILPAWRAKQLHGAGIIGGPVYFYYEPSRLALSFFSSLAPYTTVSDPTLDALSDKINQTVDQAERTKLGRQLSDLLSKQLWGEGLVTVSSLALFGPNVAEWTDDQGMPIRQRVLAALDRARQVASPNS